MAQLILEIPEDLASRLESLAAAQNKSMEQVVLEQLCSLETTPGSPSLILRAMKQLPHLHPSVIDELEAAIRNGRLAAEEQDIFGK